MLITALELEVAAYVDEHRHERDAVVRNEDANGAELHNQPCS